MIFRFLVVQLLLVSMMSAQAGDILRGGAPMGPTTGSVSYGTQSANLAKARANAKDALARTTEAIQAVKAMQAAARSVAKAKGANNLGADPNHPGQTLPNVPNGLGVGGLQVAPGVPADLSNPVSGEDPSLWTGAKLPTQTTSKGKTTVTIEQTSQQAILNWQTFNIGKDTTLNFDQSAGGADVRKWIAFNKINDPRGAPSQILGSLNALGQVYIINLNGIIFGGGSQVNTHALVASSLPINDNLISSGLLQNPDDQFQFSALALPAGSKGTSAFIPPTLPEPGIGPVIVMRGAVIDSPTNAEHVGGRAALIGANVTNEGTILTPDGQTVLAAGLQVGMNAHSSSDASLRGLDFYVGAVEDTSSSLGAYAGTATNKGLISAARGNVTLTGKDVEQLGVIDSTTSVSLNGSISLLANYNAVKNPAYDAVTSPDNPFLFADAGLVTLGEGSVNRILPELDSSATVIGTQLALKSKANIQGESIHFDSGSITLAPNADLTAKAGVWKYTGGSSLFTYSNGQIYLDSGAAINVAGSIDVSAPMDENFLKLQLRGAELADSPTQRAGALRGPTITLDLRKFGVYNGVPWIGTPLGNVSGYVNLIERTVGELTTAGGTVNMNAGNSVVMQQGASIDVSGGWINYQGGMVETTRVTSNGRLYDISQATPDRIYDGIYNGTFTTDHAKWGVAEIYANPFTTNTHYEAGYTSGANGGSVSITAPSMALDGSLLGSTVSGPRQIRSTLTSSFLPASSSLSLAFQGQDYNTLNFCSPAPPSIIFQDQAGERVPAFALDSDSNPVALPKSRQDTLNLSPELVANNNFGILSIDNSDGSILLPASVQIENSVLGAISLKGANIDILGSIRSPGGKVNLTVYDSTPNPQVSQSDPNAPPPAADTSRGNFTLGSNGGIDASGLVFDERQSSSDRQTQPWVINGGSISINAFSADLQAGSWLDVSGGGVLGSNGKVTYGNAGSITIKAGQDPAIPALFGGKLVLNSELKGYSGKKAGSLSIQAPLVQIGGSVTQAWRNAGGLLFSSDFFSQGGFGDFTITGLGAAGGQLDQYVPAVTIAANTIIDPTVQSYIGLTSNNGSVFSLSPTTLPAGQRTAANLSFVAAGVKDPSKTASLAVRGDLVMESGAEIITVGQTDSTRGVSLSGDTVSVLGSIIAPGGTIKITGKSSSGLFLANTGQALPTVYLGPNSHLSAAGTTVLTPDSYNRRTGLVLPGGSVSITGNILAATGSVIDVSGASDVLEFSPAKLQLLNSGNGVALENSIFGLSNGLTSPLYVSAGVPLRIDSNGGSITLKGIQELYSDAQLLGNAGGSTALGGSLSVSSGSFKTDGSLPTPLDPNLLVTQTGFAIHPGSSPIGTAVLDKNGDPLPFLGMFAANRFTSGGFDSLTLGGAVKFQGKVKIQASENLSVATGGVLYADADVLLKAPHVSLGTAFQEPISPLNPPLSVFTDSLGQVTYFAPTYGSGKLTVVADLLDIGNLSFQNIGQANLSAGDIRGDGTLDIAGNLTLRAGQVYAPTATAFNLFAYNYASGNGSITIEAAGNRQTPLSAGSALNLYASTITQNGVLRAPLGTINLGWDGTGTATQDLIAGTNISVPVTQTLTLGKGSLTSVTGVDPTLGSMLIPYGISPDGTIWIDPRGIDITTSGVPGKRIALSGLSLDVEGGAKINIAGGGDLYAYRWVSGNQGTQDILNSSSKFAIIPGYAADYAPYGAFNTSSSASALGGNPGYVNKTLNVGDRIYLSGGNGLDAGVYTLLPARYALLPGAFLISNPPQNEAGVALGQNLLPDGSSLVAGYRFNDLNRNSAPSGISSLFEVASASVVNSRAEYDGFTGSAFLRLGALKAGSTVPRLPNDSGQLVIQASTAMAFKGSVSAQSDFGGRGGLVDISSPVDIVLAKPGVSAEGSLVLDSSELSSFGAESLLVGGVRTMTPDGTKVTVTTGNILVDNAGAPLSSPEVVLVANKAITLADGAEILQSGNSGAPADHLLFGNSSVAGSGDGAMLRVSADPEAQSTRVGLSASTVPSLAIGSNVQLSGVSLTLDSSSATSIDPTAQMRAQTVNLNSGRISFQLDNPGSLQSSPGLVLSGPALAGIESTAKTLSLLSYSSIDFYGTGSVGNSNLSSLALHGVEIRGFNNAGGDVTVAAQDILLDGAGGGTAPGAVGGREGSLTFQSNTLKLGAGNLAIDQFAKVGLNGNSGVIAAQSGQLSTQGDLSITSPVFTAGKKVTYNVTSAGALALGAGAGQTAAVSGGLGGSLSLTGASIDAGGNISLRSGILSLCATNGDLNVSGNLDVSGASQTFFDLVKYTPGGQISLASDLGSVAIGSSATVNVSADSKGGNAGSLTISAPTSTVTVAGQLLGRAGVGGQGGTLSIDVGHLPGGMLSSISSAVSGFDLSRSIRDRLDSLVIVAGDQISKSLRLSADNGSILVIGTVDASGQTGGLVDLKAKGSVTLADGSKISVAGLNFDNAGKGGAVYLEAGSEENGAIDTNALVDIQAGSTIDLSVSSIANAQDPAAQAAADALLGKFAGTLHVRAPQTANNSDLQVAPINGTIVGASNITLEGYQLFDLTATGGKITSAGSIKAGGGVITSSAVNIQGSVLANGKAFLGDAGSSSSNYDAMLGRLFANNTGLESLAILQPGAEIINRTGALTLASDWDLSSYRFGPNSAPGMLTLRAAGDLVFNGALSDGFARETASAPLFSAPLMELNPLLPSNAQAWSYRLTSGADLGAADFHQVKSLAQLGDATASTSDDVGSLQLGVSGVGSASSGNTGTKALTSDQVKGHYQVIRTGAGDIDISTGRNVQLLNQFATIYTAGAQVADPTMGGSFEVPPAVNIASSLQGNLGATQETNTYAAQYTLGGGNVSINAQGDIKHLTFFQNQWIDDSERQLPDNWLYRRGYVGTNGQFGTTISGDVASTTWWVDFSNFFEGVGALGGGNVNMTAGGTIRNVDAVVPTNARMPMGTPNAASLVELGGGDLRVQAGKNIDGGVYYVERGKGVLSAGNEITTNSTRSPSVPKYLDINATVLPSQTWLPTTLFLGKGSFDVTARGDLLLGPVVNPFLLPQGISNTFFYKTYFSTYAPGDVVEASSLGGNLTLRESVTLPNTQTALPILAAWMSRVSLLKSNPKTLSYYQPWLRLAEDSVAPQFNTLVNLAPPSLKLTAYSGDIDWVGSLNLYPASNGTLELAAGDSINALQPNGVTNFAGTTVPVTSWGSGLINLSDTSPDSLPGIASPMAFQSIVGLSTTAARTTGQQPFTTISSHFKESGSVTGAHAVSQAKQILHDPGLLHANDSSPLRLYALGGDISGLTLFSGKFSRILAGNDITDVGLYLQNDRLADVSVVSAGRDLVAFDSSSRLLQAASQTGNSTNSALNNSTTSPYQSGDIQIGGPGTLEVFAGRNLDLGTGANNADGTGTGITSIGNARNPSLPFGGANLLIGSGIGIANGLAGSNLGLATFISQYLDPASAAATGKDYLAELNTNWASFLQLSPEEQDRLALQAFFLVLRDSGRAGSAGYSNGFAAIQTLFPASFSWNGSITTHSRDIRTKSGGAISIFSPGGGLTLGNTNIGNPDIPPGIITETGGNISVFTDQSVDIGISRIFTLRGGNIVIWSSKGNIAAGSSSKTVASAPPVRVLVDPQSADIQTDLAGLATGGGIGVLATVAGVAPGTVDLIAVSGAIDAGDAGIRASGQVHLAAPKVLNASNIQAAGSVSGVPTTAVSAPNISGISTASNPAAASTNAATQAQQQASRNNASEAQDVPSIITVEVIGYGGGDGDQGGEG